MQSYLAFAVANGLDPTDAATNFPLFLASDEARYITGVTLPVDAGFGIK